MLTAAFPSRPGRREILTFSSQTSDSRLRDLAARVIEIIDRGGSFTEIQKIRLSELGINFPSEPSR